ncbi:hypothetical protein ACFOEX_01825, partial [Camelimonas abortus]
RRASKPAARASRPVRQDDTPRDAMERRPATAQPPAPPPGYQAPGGARYLGPTPGATPVAPEGPKAGAVPASPLVNTPPVPRPPQPGTMVAPTPTPAPAAPQPSIHGLDPSLPARALRGPGG